MEKEKWRIVPMRESHIREAVRTHLQAFPNFFLSFLGSTFLNEFYRAFLQDRDAIALVAEDPDGGFGGVIVGTIAPQGFFKRLLIRRFLAFFRASVAAFLRRPSIARRLLRALRYRGESSTDIPRALLSSVAVEPSRQGGGVGRLLVLQWLASVQARGCFGCYLTTDALGNEKVNAFYRHTGWRLEATYATPEGRRMNRYLFDFNPAPSLSKDSG
jgi:GNAT superfamily N-acetyltransferase